MENGLSRTAAATVTVTVTMAAVVVLELTIRPPRRGVG